MTDSDSAPTIAESKRIERLREVEEELRILADTDTPYAKHAQRYLDQLEAADEH